MKKIAIAAVFAMAFAAPSYATMMNFEMTKMKIEESIIIHPLPEADAMKVKEAIMKADELHKAGKEDEAGKALGDIIMTYKIDMK